MKNKILLIITIILIGIFNLIIPNSVNAITNNIKWNKSPIVLYATFGLNKNEILALKSAMVEWNSIGKGLLFIYGGQLNSKIVSIDGINTVGKAPIVSISTIANTNTRFLIEEREIIEADIALNTNINLTKYNMKIVFMHELGHVLGLADTDEINSIMYRYYYDENVSQITDYDILDIDSLYKK